MKHPEIIAIVASLALAGFAVPAQAQDEEESAELEGYSVSSKKRQDIDSGQMKIEIEKPTFDSGFNVDKPKPSMSGIRMERPKLQVMQAPARPARTGQGGETSEGSAAGNAGATGSAGGENRSIRPVRMDPPDYPRSALRRGQEGHVVVEFTIGTDGSTKDIEIIESEPRGVFDRDAERAVRRWQFDPALRDGRPVEVRLQHTIDFNLSDEQGSLVPVQEESFAYIGTGDNAVRPVAMPPPEYPRSALRRRIEGEVVVAFTVTGDGQPEDIRILDAAPRGTFEEKALEAVKEWRFEPLNDGGALQVRHIIEFSLSSP